MADEKEKTEDGASPEAGPEAVRFEDSEFIACGKCGRNNPPNRPSCLYCGSPVEAPPEIRANYWPVVRKAEPWESGFNVIVRGSREDLSGDAVGKIASGMKLDREIAGELLLADEPMPIARVASRGEAEAVAAKLEATGLTCDVITDEELKLREPQIRLRGAEFSEEGIVVVPFPAEQPSFSIAPALVVEGFIVRKLLEASEGRRRKAGKITDAVETGSDEPVLDIYGPEGIVGYRIRTDGFDFSVLGEKKAFTATENIRLLAAELRSRFPGAEFVSGYKGSRHLLGQFWPTTESVSSEGVERKSFGGYTKKSAHSTSNEEQFLRYSRLRQLLRSGSR